MLTEVLGRGESLPDVWGEGSIFAFSGMDGETNTISQFVATYGSEPFGLLFHTPTRRVLSVLLPEPGTVRVATGDVYGVATTSGDLVVAYASWHTIVGIVPEGTHLSLGDEGGGQASHEGDTWVSEDSFQGDALVLVREANRFALAYGGSASEATARAKAGLAEDLEDVVRARLAICENVPRVGGREQRLLNKCASVMKVNSLAPEGAIARRWSTPDRVPHKHMWLWDSVFHSLAMNRLDAGLSWDYLAAVLDTANPDGMIPHMSTVDGHKSSITQPPILAWGVWENYLVLKDKDRLAQAIAPLEGYLEWDLTNRDRNGNALLEWHIEGDVRCRSGESGLDNSPRFDAATVLDAVDFSVFAACDMGYLARVARELGDLERARRWQARSEAVTAQVHDLLWDNQDRFYHDRGMDGTLSRVRAVSGFLPLLLDDIAPDRVDSLVAALHDPSDFGTAFPVPSVSASHPEYSTDMWRGATWLNLNYAICVGLLKQGRDDEARWLAETSLSHVAKYYQEYGVLFEFFDSQDRVPPPQCDRKGPHVEPYDVRRKMDSIRDYHWTAAVTAIWLLEGHTIS